MFNVSTQDSTDGIPVHRTLLLSLSPTLAPLLTSSCCATPLKVLAAVKQCLIGTLQTKMIVHLFQVMLSESREAAVSAAVALLYTGSYSLSEVFFQESFTFLIILIISASEGLVDIFRGSCGSERSSRVFGNRARREQSHCGGSYRIELGCPRQERAGF